MIAGIARRRDRKSRTRPRIKTDNTDREVKSENSERMPFKVLNAPIKVNPSGRRKNLSRILKAGTPRVSTKDR
jgi:hypothetical protein